MSKPFTYWVRLALVATLCTLVTFSPVSAGRLMDRLLHRDHCKTAKNGCEQSDPCESSLVVLSVPCQVAPPAACHVQQSPTVPCCQPSVVETLACDSAPPCGCDSVSPAIIAPAPIVEHVPIRSEPVAEHPTPFVVQPSVEHAAPVIKQAEPVIKQAAPVIKQPDVIKQPEPVVKQQTPVVKQPDVVKQPEVVKQPDVVKQPAPVTGSEAFKQPDLVNPFPTTEKPVQQEPARVPGQSTQPAPNPFDGAPPKAADLDVFGAEPTSKTPENKATETKEPEIDPFGGNSVEPTAKANDLDVFGETPPVNKPAAEPALPTTNNNELDDLFKSAPETKSETKTDSKADDLFRLDAEPTPTLPQENVPSPPPPAKTPDSELEDLFKDKPGKPVADNAPSDPIGKPVTTEVELIQVQPGNAAADDTSRATDALLESLFDNSPVASQPSPDPTAPKPVVLETDVPKPAVPASLPEAMKPETNPPATDELDALFGISAFAPPSDFQGAEYRLWVDNSGAYQVKARLAVIYVDKVKLLKENGKFSTVPLSRLSEADFGYVSWVASNLSGEQTARMVKTKSNESEPEVDR